MAAIALSLWLVFAFADDRAAVSDFLGDAAAELSNGNARGFMKRFDRDMPGYGKLETEVYALVKLAGVGSAAQVLEIKTFDEGLDVTVDWFVELRPHGQDLTSERRRELVELRLKRVGKSWKILTLQPQTLFHAPRL
jgi:hypothetical protein